MSLDELIERLGVETEKATDDDEMAVALLDIERQLQSCARRFNSTLRKR